MINRLVGQLYYCMRNRQTFDSAKAFPLTIKGEVAVVRRSDYGLWVTPCAQATRAGSLRAAVT